VAEIQPTATVYPGTVLGEGDRRKVANDGAMVVRALERLTDSLSAVGAA